MEDNRFVTEDFEPCLSRQERIWQDDTQIRTVLVFSIL